MVGKKRTQVSSSSYQAREDMWNENNGIKGKRRINRYVDGKKEKMDHNNNKEQTKNNAHRPPPILCCCFSAVVSLLLFNLAQMTTYTTSTHTIYVVKYMYTRCARSRFPGGLTSRWCELTGAFWERKIEALAKELRNRRKRYTAAAAAVMGIERCRANGELRTTRNGRDKRVFIIPSSFGRFPTF